MEIELTKATLGDKRLFVATPMYGGSCLGVYAKACIDLQAVGFQYEVPIRYSYLFNESLIQRARNYLVDEFLRSDCTHMMFIDADISFNPIDVIAMLAMDKDVIGGPYPKKCIKWSNIKKAVMKNPNISDGELAALGGDIVFNPVSNGATNYNISELMEVMEIGTGFMMIKRETFELYEKNHPERLYTPDHFGTEFFGGDRKICSYFNVEIDPESNRTLSEDYQFCQELRKLGIPIWMTPWIELGHTGTITFQGSLPKVAQYLGGL